MNKSNTHLPGGTRVGSGLRTGLAGLIVSLMSLGFVQTASADVFNSANADPTGVSARIDKLEQELKAIRGGGAVASPGAAGVPGVGGLTLPPPEELGKVKFPGAAPSAPPAAPEEVRREVEQFVVMGKVNGKTLVKQGEVRFMLTDRQLAEFVQSRPNLGVRRLGVKTVSDQMEAAEVSPAKQGQHGAVSKATASDNAALARATSSMTPPAPPPIGSPSPTPKRDAAAPKAH